jgi:site-specific DNA recombinase
MSKYFEHIKSFAKGDNQLTEKKINGRNAVVYTRVSSKEQMDNMSLETQLKGCNAFAQKLNYQICGHFGGTYESAQSDERKEFVRMISFVKKAKAKISYIIVYSLERFSRTGDNAIWLSRQLRELGITIASVTQPIDTSNPSGVLQQNILFLFSQYDNDLRRQKSVAGMKEKLLKGEWMGVVPIGYKFDRSSGTREQKIVFNEDADLMKKAFMMKIHSGMNNIEIAEAITKMGLKLTYKRISQAFRNPFYCGYVSHSLLEGEVVKGKHPALISENLFLQVNEILKKVPQGFQRKNENTNMPLRQFMTCAYCGTPLTGYQRRKALKNGKVLHFHYYKCYTTGCKCNRSVDFMHDTFAEFLADFQLDKNLLPLVKKQLRITWQNGIESTAGEQKSMLAKLSDLQETLDNVEERWADGKIEEAVYEKRSTKLKEEIVKISKELEKHKVNISNPETLLDEYVVFTSELAICWLNGDYEERKMVQNILFPEGILFDKKIDAFRTSQVNEVIRLIAEISKNCGQKNRRQVSDIDDLSPSVVRTGIEPVLPE